MIRFALLALFSVLPLSLLACEKSSPPPSTAAAENPPSTAASENSPASEPAAPATSPGANSGMQSKCGVGGTSRKVAKQCDYVVELANDECCFQDKERACKEAGCSLATCDLRKSEPPVVFCK